MCIKGIPYPLAVTSVSITGIFGFAAYGISVFGLEQCALKLFLPCTVHIFKNVTSIQ
jgi:hypothetical protein